MEIIKEKIKLSINEREYRELFIRTKGKILSNVETIIKIKELLSTFIKDNKLEEDNFDEVFKFYDELIELNLLDTVMEYNNRNVSCEHSYYDFRIGDISYSFFEKLGKDYCSFPQNVNFSEIASEANFEGVIHLNRCDLSIARLISLINRETKIVIEDNDSYKCDRVFVGIDNSKSKINTNEHEFLKNYPFINSELIDLDLLNFASGLEHLSDNGVMVFNTYASFLFKNDINSVAIRKYLIDNKMIKGIILTKSFSGLCEYEATLIITKQQNDDIVFVDAKSNKYRQFYQIEGYYSESNEFNEHELALFALLVYGKKENYGISKLVCYDEIIRNNYKLGFTDYLKINEEVKHRRLEDIARDIIQTYEEMDRNIYWYRN